MAEVRGTKWPFQFRNGGVAMSSGDQHTREGIMQVIGTAKGEVPMLPGWGCDIHRRVFDPVNQAALAANDIRDAVARLMPGVEVTTVDIEVSR